MADEEPGYEPWELEAAKASVADWEKQGPPADPAERVQYEAARERVLARWRERFGPAFPH